VNFKVQPSSLTGGIVEVPGDKSISHRALMFSAIASGRARISGFLAGDDCLHTLAALQAMGIAIERHSGTALTVHGKGLHGLSAPESDLDMGNSGTAMRLFSGLLSGQAFGSVLTGDESLSARPMKRVIQPLSLMGARIQSSDGKPPLRIQGGGALHGISYESPVASAQVKSAILLAGLYADGETSVREPAITRDHTERMLAAMGANLRRSDRRVSVAGGAELRAVDVDVPADLSSAVFPLLAAIVSEDSDVVVRNVGINPTRTGVLQILEQMGANIRIDNERHLGEEPVADISACASELTGIEVDPALVSLAIDEFPLLFAAAAVAAGETRFSGIAELRVKESDRIGSMALGLAELGIEVSESADGAIVKGGTLTGGKVASFGDHRIAMAFASVANRASDTVTILDTEAVDTSFPGFIECMQAIGTDITVADS
jgi:3-phosphoshikimate 1-carboxyvinyltransferase